MTDINIHLHKYAPLCVLFLCHTVWFIVTFIIGSFLYLSISACPYHCRTLFEWNLLILFFCKFIRNDKFWEMKPTITALLISEMETKYFRNIFAIHFIRVLANNFHATLMPIKIIANRYRLHFWCKFILLPPCKIVLTRKQFICNILPWYALQCHDQDNVIIYNQICVI